MQEESIFDVWQKELDDCLGWTQSYGEDFGIKLNQCFKVPFNIWISIVFIFSKDLHLTWSELCKMPFFEILLVMDKYKEYVEEQNENQKKQNASQEAQMAQMRKQMPDYSRMQQPQTPSMPSMPQMPSPPSMPSMPSFNMPSMPSFGS